MARGNSRAQSEAGTRSRTFNYEGRLRAAATELERADRPGFNPTEQIAKVQEILRIGSGRDEKYDIQVNRGLEKAGKLNMMDATIDGKDINNKSVGAFDRTFVKSRATTESDNDFNYEATRGDIQQGFIFAKDAKGDIFALPHNWNVNRPLATVGVFAGDTLNFLGSQDGKQPARKLEVIGTFDFTKRGLNLAAAACGDAIGRKGGIKQTATILTTSGGGQDLTNQNFQYKHTVLPDSIVDGLNGDAEYRANTIGIKKKEG
jgi:hypothetical protein